MKFVHILSCVALGSFMIGMFCATECSHKPEKPSKVPDVAPAVSKDMITSNKGDVEILNGANPGLKPCSSSTQMPCEVSPRDPVRESLEAREKVKELFEVGEKVTCIYRAVYSWDNGDEYVKNVGVQCKVTIATEAFEELEPGYQQLKVNCGGGLKKLWGDKGSGMVKGHKLNFVERWVSSTDCYHFSS